MSERDELIARLRMMDTDDRRLPFHCMRYEAADLLERDGAELARLQCSITALQAMRDAQQEELARLRAEVERLRDELTVLRRDLQVEQVRHVDDCEDAADAIVIADQKIEALENERDAALARALEDGNERQL